MSKPGYQHLLTYQQLEEIYDLTNQFCKQFLPGRENLRLREQMIHAARSAKQCLVEGYEQESLKGYIKLTGVSRGSLKELLEDYKDFARNHQIEIWDKGDKRVKQMLNERKQRKNDSQWILPLTPFDPFNPLYSVNYLLNLVNMTTYLLDRQIDSLKEKFVKQGGWTENIFRQRLSYRQKQAGFGLIGVLIVLTVLIIIATGGKVVWEKKIGLPIKRSAPAPTLQQPTQVPTDLTCNKECVNRGFISGRCKVEGLYSCTADEVGISITFCGGEVGFKCCCGKKDQDPSKNQFPCLTDAECPQKSSQVSKCLNNRCVYVKNTRSLQSCLEEANQARKRVCEEMKIPLDEYGNCVGVDFVKDPYQECYDKYGQK